MPFELTILGSSSALPTSDRYPSAQVLQVLGRFFLIDCGEGTQIQIRRSKINFAKIKHIFISHLHGDHYYGLIGLISTMNLLGLKQDLHIYSHSELKNLIQAQLDFIKGEMKITLIFHPLNFKKPQKIFSDKKVEIYSFPVKHSIPTCGFLFKEIEKPANIKKEVIQKFNIPIAKIKEIKAGTDFITNKGERIKNEKSDMEKLKKLPEEKFLADLYQIETFVPYKYSGKKENIRENWQDSYEEVQEMISNSRFEDAVNLLQSCFYSLFYYNLVNEEISKPITDALSQASGLEYHQAAPIFLNGMQAIMEDSFAGMDFGMDLSKLMGEQMQQSMAMMQQLMANYKTN